MNFRTTHADDNPDINLIPLIDVLLVILIFLAATTTFTRVHELDVQLPQAQATSAATHPMQLAISSDGLYALNGELLPARGLDELAQAFSESHNSMPTPAYLFRPMARRPTKRSFKC